MAEGVGKGARDLRTRVTERDRRVSLVGLATNRVFNGEPFVFNPLSPCDLIPFEPQDRRNVSYPFFSCTPYIYIYLHSLHLSSYRVARTIDGADIELNFSNLTRLDGDISHSPLGFLERSSSRRYEGRMDGRDGVGKKEKELETGETGKCSANANENGEEEEVLVDSWCTAVPMETLGGHSYFNLSLLLSSGDPRKSNLSTPLFLHITPNLLLSPSPSRSREIGNDRNRGYDKHR